MSAADELTKAAQQQAGAAENLADTLRADQEATERRYAEQLEAQKRSETRAERQVAAWERIAEALESIASNGAGP